MFTHASVALFWLVVGWGYRGNWALCLQVALVIKNAPANTGDIEMQVQSLGQKDPLEEGMATHSSILAWRIPWAEETGGLQPMGLHKVEHD